MKWFISHNTIRSPFQLTLEKDCGEKVSHCYQCGKCSAGCPISFQMDYLPNQIIRMVQLGMEEQVLSSRAIWLCASCLTCTVRCPREIDIAEIMDYLRRRAYKKGIIPAEETEIPLFNKIFLRNIELFGRLYEMGLIGMFNLLSGEFFKDVFLAPVVNGKSLYYSYVIVGKDSKIEALDGLKGKTFAFVDPISNTGKLIPTYMLHELGETPQSFFKEYSYTYGHDRSIKSVAQGIVDGAAVDSLIWDYMDKKDGKYTQKTKIIKISKPYGIPPVVVRPGLDEELKIQIKDILLNMHSDEEGDEILKGMFIDRFVEIEDSSYDTIREVSARIVE